MKGPSTGHFHLCQSAYLAVEAALAGAATAGTAFLATAFLALTAFFAGAALAAGAAATGATVAAGVTTGVAAIAEIAKAVITSAISFFIFSFCEMWYVIYNLLSAT